MKINEVEALVGITKKNIRFYEAEGLLCPQRNSENGYRDYSDGDVAILRQIKLLRKLGLPLEEIRRIQSGRLTVSDAMRRHQVTLEREEKTLHQAQELCHELAGQALPLAELDAAALLERIEQMEKEGASFMDVQKNDVRKKYVAPVAVTVLVILFMVGLIAFVAWALSTDMPPKPVILFLAMYLLAGLGVIFGVIWCLRQRIKEIQGGEEDEARKY
jgi:DNA-binding transcriptional MerR regulator